MVGRVVSALPALPHVCTSYIMQHAMCSAFLARDARALLSCARGHLQRQQALVVAPLDAAARALMLGQPGLITAHKAAVLAAVRLLEHRRGDAHLHARRFHGPDGIGVAPVCAAVSAARGGEHAGARAGSRPVPRAPGTAQHALLEQLALLLEPLAFALLIVLRAVSLLPVGLARALLENFHGQHPQVRLPRQLSDADRASV